MSKIIFLLVGLFVNEIASNGMMLDPINRSSRWRQDDAAETDYDDNDNNCGGYWVQNGVNGGRCGVCGDSYTAQHPQDNENTGKYGNGVVVARYSSGSNISILIDLTANHLGSFSYSLCVLEDPKVPESGEDCFMPLLLEDGSAQYSVGTQVGNITNRVQLPVTRCDRCVLRWTYRTANYWGQCDDGTSAVGCGPQEHFRSCADISII